MMKKKKKTKWKKRIKIGNANTAAHRNHPRRRPKPPHRFSIWKRKQVTTMTTTKRLTRRGKTVSRWMKRRGKLCVNRIVAAPRPDDSGIDPWRKLPEKLRAVIVCNVGRSIDRHYWIVPFPKRHPSSVIEVTAAVAVVVVVAERVAVSVRRYNPKRKSDTPRRWHNRVWYHPWPIPAFGWFRV